jgi:hypothetical protein
MITVDKTVLPVSVEVDPGVSPVVFVTEPAPPRSLYAVNATHSSVTLLWSGEGVVDFYQVLCKPTNTINKDLKVRDALSSVMVPCSLCPVVHYQTVMVPCSLCPVVHCCHL